MGKNYSKFLLRATTALSVGIAVSAVAQKGRPCDGFQQ
jgi:hypothetical protein